MVCEQQKCLLRFVVTNNKNRLRKHAINTINKIQVTRKMFLPNVFFYILIHASMKETGGHEAFKLLANLCTKYILHRR